MDSNLPKLRERAYLLSDGDQTIRSRSYERLRILLSKNLAIYPLAVLSSEPSLRNTARQDNVTPRRFQFLSYSPKRAALL